MSTATTPELERELAQKDREIERLQDRLRRLEEAVLWNSTRTDRRIDELWLHLRRERQPR